MLVLLSALLASAPLATADGLCAAAGVVPDKACVATGHGVVLAPDRADASRLAGSVLEAEARFARHFGRAPPRHATVQDAKPGELKALGGAGFLRTLPWLTPAQFEASALQSIRRGVEAQTKAAGLDAARTAEAVARGETAWRERNTLAAFHARDAGSLPHEAGHGWYMRSFWPDRSPDGRGHYGGPGPDWMDETAAVLLENDAFTADRRRMFEEVYRGTPASQSTRDLSVAELIDLPRFLTRAHPGSEIGSALATKDPAVKDGPNIRVLSGDEARNLMRGGLLFYLQSRLFADYLIERSGDPAIFASLGAAFGRGETIDDWLRVHGAGHKLPATVDALDAAWRAWLRGRYGAPVV